MEISASGLGSRLAEALACLDRGESVTVTFRGKPRARLVCIESPREEAVSPAFGMWKSRADMADVETQVRRLRNERFHAGASGVTG